MAGTNSVKVKEKFVVSVIFECYNYSINFGVLGSI